MTNQDTPAPSVSSGMFDNNRQALQIGREKICIEVRDLDLFYGTEQALKSVNLRLRKTG